MLVQNWCVPVFYSKGHKPSNIYNIHDGLVHTVQRSPFFKDIILTVGGWNFAIWKEGVTVRPSVMRSHKQGSHKSKHSTQ